MGIAADIKRELRRRNWTVYKLARESGIEEGTLSSIVRDDSNPRIDTVIPIARAFGITIDELVQNPKPLEKTGKKSMSVKDMKKVLIEYGLEPDDVEVVSDVIRSMNKKRQAKERGEGEAEETAL